MDTHPLLDLLRAAFEGDPYVVPEAFTADATFQDTPSEPVLEGHDELTGYFAAYGGRRERFSVQDLVDAGDRLAVRYAVHFRADAHAYAQRGVAVLDLESGAISRWRGVWTETEEELDAWDGD